MNKICLLANHPLICVFLGFSFPHLFCPSCDPWDQHFLYWERWKGWRKPTKLVMFIHQNRRLSQTKQTYQFFLFFHKRYWGKLPHPKSENMCGEILRKILHKSRSCCVGVSHNPRWKRAEQTFFISINNMLLCICVKRFTESFLLALDYSNWQ